MAYLVVENFSAGLDTRRHPLTSRPGTLQKLKNAHVSRGGEIEKRKAFTSFQNLSSGALLPGCKGLQATSDRIYVFQRGNQGAADVQVGNVWIQYIQHPQNLFMGVFGGPTLSDIVYSTLYGGKPFVLAKWSDDSVYPYWDGKILSDFVIGRTQSWMIGSNNQQTWGNLAMTFVWSIKGETFGNSTTGWDSQSGYTVDGAYVEVTAPLGVEFTASATADTPLAPVSISTVTPYKAAVPETLSSGFFSITGGSTTAATAFRGFNRYLDAASLPGIRSIRVGASSPSAADGLDLIGWGSPTGLRLDTYTPTDPLGSPAGALLWNIRKAINDNTTSGLAHGYSSRWASYGGWSGNDPADIWIDAPSILGSGANGLLVQVEFDSDPTGVGSLQEFVDTNTIAVSPYNPSRYIATLGTFSGGSFNRINSVKVDGIEVLGAPVSWQSSHGATAQAVATQINSYTSSTEYVASVDDGSKVVLKALSGTGKTPNGRVISVVTDGNVIVSGISSFSGGVDSVAAQRQTVRYGFSGTFYPNYNVQLVATPASDPSNPLYWGSSRVINTTPVSALTFKTKAHITSGSSLFFSGVNQPTKWGQNGTGAGFINMSNNNGGNEVLTGLALYQGQLAAFARRSVQVWGIDTDPANNRQGQVLSNTGALGQKSIVSVGEIDVFYLSDSGVRSLRARDSSNSAVVNDVGTPIDNLVLADLSGLTDAQKASCPSIIEPIDGRYWIAVGSKIYVFSYFPNSQVAAWSTYEPGFSPEWFTTMNGRVYVRSGNMVYLYGGLSGNQYDNSEVEVVMPYLDGGKPAHNKTLMGLDMTVEGSWNVQIGMNPISTEARDDCGTITQPTFSLGRVQAVGMGTHVGIKLVNQSSGYARLANIICHFEFNESD